FICFPCRQTFSDIDISCLCIHAPAAVAERTAVDAELRCLATRSPKKCCAADESGWGQSLLKVVGFSFLSRLQWSIFLGRSCCIDQFFVDSLLLFGCRRPRVGAAPARAGSL
ncbi:unnamed protein product, partial [Ectocarpus sp. 12 AP-2014]